MSDLALGLVLGAAAMILVVISVQMVAKTAPGQVADKVATAVCIERGFTDGRWDGQKVVCRQITYGDAK